LFHILLHLLDGGFNGAGGLPTGLAPSPAASLSSSIRRCGLPVISIRLPALPVILMYFAMA
jgi:hypothetical protein